MKRVAKRRRTARRGGRVRSGYLATKRFVFKLDVIGANTVPEQGGAISFSLGDVPGGSEFVSMFDQYKIIGIRYRWVATRTAAGNSGNVNTYPRVGWVHDYTDGSAPTTFSELQQYEKFKENYFTDAKPVSKWYWLTPAVLPTIGPETLGVSSGLQPKFRQWIRTENPSVGHYGIKYRVADNYLDMRVRMECYYYCTFKNVN